MTGIVVVQLVMRSQAGQRVGTSPILAYPVVHFTQYKMVDPIFMASR
jgi:hypothetical protein